MNVMGRSVSQKLGIDCVFNFEDIALKCISDAFR